MLKHTMLVLQPKIKKKSQLPPSYKREGGELNSGFRVFVISNVFLCAQGSKTLPVNYSFQERDGTGVNFSFRK